MADTFKKRVATPPGFKYAGLRGDETPANTVELSIGYEKGGPNYFTGGTNERGYYLHLTPCTITHERGYETQSVMAFGGYKVRLATVARANPHKEKKVIAAVVPYLDSLAAAFIKHDRDEQQKTIDNIKAAAVSA